MLLIILVPAVISLYYSIFPISGRTIGEDTLLRTAAAVTMANSGICFRLALGDTGQGLISHIKKVNKNIPIDIKALRLEERLLISSTASTGYKTLEGVKRAVYTEALIAPYIVLAGTDAINMKRYQKKFIVLFQLKLIHLT